ncbi:MAG: LVIVD repeat-containing protein [Actinomadura sp.]
MASGKRRKVWACLAAAGAAALTALALAPSPTTASAFPAVDEVSKSDNVRHLANIPKQAPFDTMDNLNSDIAFKGDFAFAGNYSGFAVYDIDDARRPRLVTQVVCPGSQNDISVAGNLLFLSTDSSRSNDSCDNVPQSGTIKESWEGIKIFDISDVRNPRYVKSVETKCGSHTHTLIPGKKNTMFVYVSSYNPSATLPDCQPPHDKISVIKVDTKNPASAALVAEPVLFPDGANPGDGNPFPEGTSATSGCHDLTAYPEKKIMAGACMGDGVLFDISNPLAPRVIDSVRDDENFAFWHSATFNNSANKIVFTDELGGGGAPTCNATIGSEKGADGVYDIVGKGDGRRLVFRSYFKITRDQADTENCVAHNGSLIPVPGKDIMVQAWYQGGVQVWDFTDSRNPKQIAFFERGPLSDTENLTGGSWSAYYYNGFVYSNDIQKGLDVLEIRDKRTDPGRSWRFKELNVQSQQSYGH